jgi:hypothetical protein
MEGTPADIRQSFALAVGQLVGHPPQAVDRVSARFGSWIGGYLKKGFRIVLILGPRGPSAESHWRLRTFSSFELNKRTRRSRFGLSAHERIVLAARHPSTSTRDADHACASRHVLSILAAHREQPPGAPGASHECSETNIDRLNRGSTQQEPEKSGHHTADDR